MTTATRRRRTRRRNRHRHEPNAVERADNRAMLHDLLGFDLRDRREAVGLTAQQLAEMAGYRDKSSITQLELGRYLPTARNLVALRQVLGHSMDY